MAKHPPNAEGALTRNRLRVLIIKTGHSETLDPDPSSIASLGDVLRSTVILHLFPPTTHEVIWLTDPSAGALLDGVAGVDTVLSYGPLTHDRLVRMTFDVVVNLEKSAELCLLAATIPAERRFGFGRIDGDGDLIAYPGAERALELCRDISVKQADGMSWSAHLFSIFGADYAGQPYLIHPGEADADLLDIGLNHKVGVKFPLKRWPEANWQALHDRLAPGHHVGWQESPADVRGYVDWVQGCKVVVTNDSLGMHIAMGLGKKVIALFGPTAASEIHDAPNLMKVFPNVDWPCLPCLKSHDCALGTPCMERIAVEHVATTVERILRCPVDTSHDAGARP